MKYLLLLIVFAPLLLSAQCDKGTIIASNDIGIVETESGKVRGYIEDGIYTYKGIPYAYAERFMNLTAKLA